MYYYYNRSKNAVGYYLDLVDALHGEQKDIEHFNELATEEKKIIYCEDVNINCYISKSKLQLLRIIHDCVNNSELFDELASELLAL